MEDGLAEDPLHGVQPIYYTELVRVASLNHESIDVIFSDISHGIITFKTEFECFIGLIIFFNLKIESWEIGAIFALALAK